MMDEMANHATRVRRYIDRLGLDKVETFIDVCLSIDNLIDMHSPYIVRDRPEDPDAAANVEVHKLKSKDYMDEYINPPAWLEAQRQKLQAEQEKKRRFPTRPTRDVMAFLLEHAPLERWEADILSIIREEAYYFAPQAMTKVMNEGWACVHPDTRVFTDQGLVTMRALVERGEGEVFDGEQPQHVYDHNIIPNHATVTIRTRRGLTLCGSNNHRVLLADKLTWRRLDELAPGDQITISGGGDRWPNRAPSPSERDLLRALRDNPPAPLAQLPDAAYHAPEVVVREILQIIFDKGASVAEAGIIWPTPHHTASADVQLLLMNYGILSDLTEQPNGDWHLHITGASAQRYATRIGFGLERKQAALTAYLDAHQRFQTERWVDEIVEAEVGQHDVYDISVTQTHRYAAGGLVNHNSYWHSRLMTEHILDASEIIDYAEAYAGVMATPPGGFNPYKIGIELYRHVEERWNRGQFGKEWEECDSIADKEDWDQQLGLGRQKIFQVRAIYNDVSFIDEFLTEDFARKMKLFTFGYNKKNNSWEIQSREFAQIKQKLLTQLTNFGQPFIYVRDGNFGNRAELLLYHDFQGVELKLDYARDVLVNLYRIWRRPVNLETLLEGKGRLLTYDGTSYSDKPWDYKPLD
jgi:stage V sporulation protein R